MQKGLCLGMEQARSSQHSEGQWFLLSIVLGLVVAAVDSRWPNPGFAAPPLIVFAFFLGFVRPVRAWRWAFILVGCVILGDILHILPVAKWLWFKIYAVPALSVAYAKLGAPSPYTPSLSGSMLAIMPTLAGAYLGQWIARIAIRLRSEDEVF